MARLSWAPRADRDLVSIRHHIAQDSPANARKFVNKVFRLAEDIAEQPLLGAIVPEYEVSEIRERLLDRYRMIYRVLEDGVEIARIVHGAKPLPANPPI